MYIDELQFLPALTISTINKTIVSIFVPSGAVSQAPQNISIIHNE